MRRTVALLIFDDVEVLDFAGPFEVFAVTDELSGYSSFNVVTVAPAPATVRARNGLKVIPDFTLENCPPVNVLIVPGGSGSRALLRQPSLLEWLRQRIGRADIVMSVCTGARVLATLGLLDGLRFTTHHENLAEIAEQAPSAIPDGSQRFHDPPANGRRPRLVTAGGISAGIDASLHLVSSLLGPEAAQRTARYMEYGAENHGGGAT